MRQLTIVFVAAAALLTGCGTFQLNPVASEARVTTPAVDLTKTVTVPDGMVWYDSAQPTRGLRFPPSTYVLEAEDTDYWYFRSLEPLELRIFKGGENVERRAVPGGMMVAKRFNTVPGGAYIDGERTIKIMVWKLGAEFLAREGKQWTRNF